MKQINGHNVTDELYPKVMELIKAAWADKITLTVASGLRTFDEQLKLRQKHVIDKSMYNNKSFLLKADNGLFNPRTAKPGTSNHESGIAVDFNVTGQPEVYKWLVGNAFAYGWVRTVPSERWHFEYRPHAGKFDFVPSTHSTWDGLI